MADHGPDVLGLCPGQTQQILRDREVIDAVDVQVSGEHQVQNLSHLAGIAVFDRKHGKVALALFHGAVGILKGRVRKLCPVREDAHRCNMPEGALHAAVRDAQTLHQIMLPPRADRQHILQKAQVKRALRFLLHAGRQL